MPLGSLWGSCRVGNPVPIPLMPRLWLFQSGERSWRLPWINQWERHEELVQSESNSLWGKPSIIPVPQKIAPEEPTYSQPLRMVSLELELAMATDLLESAEQANPAGPESGLWGVLIEMPLLSGTPPDGLGGRLGFAGSLPFVPLLLGPFWPECTVRPG